MITVTLNGITNLNNSLQVGDVIYSTPTQGAQDPSTPSNIVDPLLEGQQVGSPRIVGILRRIQIMNDNAVLDIDETPFFNPLTPGVGSFLMFSKFSQTDGDIVGYFAQENFINDSKKKAELFSVGSEVTINSK